MGSGKNQHLESSRYKSQQQHLLMGMNMNECEIWNDGCCDFECYSPSGLGSAGLDSN